MVAKQKLQLKIGADPEVFLRDDETGKSISAYGLIGGSKVQPFLVPNGALQEDGMAAEFNIDPASTKKQFVANIQSVFGTLKQRLKPGISLDISPVAYFDKEYFDAQPASSKVLGCDPDYDAYTGQPNPAPCNKAAYRTASGHLHCGWGSDIDPYSAVHRRDCEAVGRQLDYSVGIWSLLWDRDTIRRTLYGRAGAIRYKTYGLEYRTLSNAWLKSQALMEYVYDWTRIGVEELYYKRINWYSLYGDLAQNIINNNIFDWPDKYPELYNSRTEKPPHVS